MSEYELTCSRCKKSQSTTDMELWFIDEKFLDKTLIKDDSDGEEAYDFYHINMICPESSDRECGSKEPLHLCFECRCAINEENPRGEVRCARCHAMGFKGKGKWNEGCGHVYCYDLDLNLCYDCHGLTCYNK